ncbi:MAG: hypothetical protein GX931_04005, partial [Acholeplasmataceae bacterium]|nr:hypothetical protein [Acholeplasmataceae bacterium]
TSENIHTLTDEQIANVSKSKTIAGGFKNEVYRMNENTPENTSSLKGKLVIPEGLIWHSTETTKGETEKILLSMKEIQGTNNFSSFDPNIDALFGKDKDKIFASKIILHTFVDNHLKPLITEEDKLAKYFEPQDYYGNEYNWYGDDDNDAIAFVKALDDLNTAGIHYNAMSFGLLKSILKSSPNKPREVNDAIVQSKIFTHSLTKMFTELVHNQGGYTSIPIYSGDPQGWGTPTQDGELIKILNVIRMLP